MTDNNSLEDPAGPAILFVDDVDVIVDELKTMLALRGIAALGAGTLDAAIAALVLAPSIRLVASDIRLHDEAGEDLVARVAAHDQLRDRNLRFLFMTGDVMRFSEGATIEGHPLLLKPVQPQVLIRTVFDLLGRDEYQPGGGARA